MNLIIVISGPIELLFILFFTDQAIFLYKPCVITNDKDMGRGVYGRVLDRP